MAENNLRPFFSKLKKNRNSIRDELKADIVGFKCGGLLSGQNEAKMPEPAMLAAAPCFLNMRQFSRTSGH